MNQHHVLILGNSLSAEAMTEVLRDTEMCVTERVSTIEIALAILASRAVDVLIMIGMPDETSRWYLSALRHYPDLPVLRSDLSTPKIQVMISRCIEARLDPLLAEIEALPRRGSARLDLEQRIRA